MRSEYFSAGEIRASQADYARMKIIDPVFCEQKTAAPHTWYAVEIFLYLLGIGYEPGRKSQLISNNLS